MFSFSKKRKKALDIFIANIFCLNALVFPAVSLYTDTINIAYAKDGDVVQHHGGQNEENIGKGDQFDKYGGMVLGSVGIPIAGSKSAKYSWTSTISPRSVQSVCAAPGGEFSRNPTVNEEASYKCVTMIKNGYLFPMSFDGGSIAEAATSILSASTGRAVAYSNIKITPQSSDEETEQRTFMAFVCPSGTKMYHSKATDYKENDTSGKGFSIKGTKCWDGVSYDDVKQGNRTIKKRHYVDMETGYVSLQVKVKAYEGNTGIGGGDDSTDAVDPTGGGVTVNPSGGTVEDEEIKGTSACPDGVVNCDDVNIDQPSDTCNSGTCTGTPVCENDVCVVRTCEDDVCHDITINKGGDDGNGGNGGNGGSTSGTCTAEKAKANGSDCADLSDCNGTTCKQTVCKTDGTCETTTVTDPKGGNTSNNGSSSSSGTDYNNLLDDLLNDNGYNSGNNSWANSGNGDGDNMDDYFNGVADGNEDLPTNMTDDLLGVDDYLNGDGTDGVADDLIGNGSGGEDGGDGVSDDAYGDDYGDYDGGDGSAYYGDEDYDGGDESSYGALGDLYEDGLAGLDGTDTSANGNGDLNSLLGAIDGNGSLADKFKALMNGGTGDDGNGGSTATAQELYDIAKKMLMANGMSLQDILNGKNYDANSAYTEPAMAWDMNRITTLIKAKKINPTLNSKQDKNDKNTITNASEKNKSVNGK